MILLMARDATKEQIDYAIRTIESLGLKAHLSIGEGRAVIGVIGDDRTAAARLENLPGVDRLVPVLPPFRLSSRDFRQQDTVVEVGPVRIGAEEIAIMAGPCAIESYEQLSAAARTVRDCGCKILRGGVFKPRSSPYNFQGLGREGLEIIAAVKKEFGLLAVTEALSPQDAALVAEYADIIQIGARNMQNFALLREVGKINKPVLLKRGMMSTIEELLLSAEYILSAGNSEIILCERGIRTFETYTRNTLDISAVPVLKRYSHLPVIVDPSHAAGHWSYVGALSKAAVAAGADGLLIEIHPNPEYALSDGKQSLRLNRFAQLVSQLRNIAVSIGKKM
jgi:3-deoxy-7-phosphoheptulonate synthase